MVLEVLTSRRSALVELETGEDEGGYRSGKSSWSNDSMDTENGVSDLISLANETTGARMTGASNGKVGSEADGKAATDDGDTSKLVWTVAGIEREDEVAGGFSADQTGSEDEDGRLAAVDVDGAAVVLDVAADLCTTFWGRVSEGPSSP